MYARVWATFAGVIAVAGGVGAGAEAPLGSGAEPRPGAPAAGATPGALASADVGDLGYGDSEPIHAHLRPAPRGPADWTAQERAASADVPPAPAASSGEPDPGAFGYATREALTEDVRRRAGIPPRYAVRIVEHEQDGRRALSAIVGPATE